MKTTFFFTALVLLPILTACAKPGQSSLPPCQTTDAYWTNCIGEKDRGVGPWKGNYVGEWKDNDYNGQGTYTSPFAKYVGEFKDGKYEGQGTMTYTSAPPLWPGGKYVGEFKDGQRNGRGTNTWPDGRNYVGEWKNDEPDGRGMMTFADGRVKSGQWQSGKFVGVGNERYETYKEAQEKADALNKEQSDNMADGFRKMLTPYPKSGEDPRWEKQSDNMADGFRKMLTPYPKSGEDPRWGKNIGMDTDVVTGNPDVRTPADAKYPDGNDTRNENNPFPPTQNTPRDEENNPIDTGKIEDEIKKYMKTPRECP